MGEGVIKLTQSSSFWYKKDFSNASEIIFEDLAGAKEHKNEKKKVMVLVGIGDYTFELFSLKTN